MFAMNLALIANNTGLMCGNRVATLTTVMMVGMYRTHEALEAAWNILHPRQRRHRACAIRHDPCLHGGASCDRRRARRHGMDHPGGVHAADFDPALLNVAFVFLLLGYGTKVGLAPAHAWLPDAHADR